MSTPNISDQYTARQIANARRRARQLHAFGTHAALYATVISLLVVVNLVQDNVAPWAAWVAMGWGVGLVAHAVRTTTTSRRDAWVERKTSELLARQ